MAAAISALNAKIRSHPVLSYFCSTRMPSPLPNLTQNGHPKTRFDLHLHRFLGSSIQFRYPDRRRHGHTKGSSYVRRPSHH